MATIRGLETFDISILELGEGVFEVKSTNGMRTLGKMVSQRVSDYLADELRKDQGIDLKSPNSTSRS